MIRVTFLGTAAARPTVGRNVSGLAVQREGDVMLFDCGEGTQRQMMRFATGFSLDGIFITHLHADHFLGITGLLRTLGLQGHDGSLDIYGPPGSARTLRETVHLGVDRVVFPVNIQELAPGESIDRGEYRIQAFAVSHGTSAVGYALVEDDRLGRFDVERARALGVPEGPLFGKLHRGESVPVDGETITPDQVVGPPRPGRTLAYTGDTAPTPSVVEAAHDADLLIHDATFGHEEVARARDTFHSTSVQAAEIAREAKAHRLAMTHLSARYSDNPGPLVEEARSVFPGAVAARDGMQIELPFRDGDEG